MFQKATYNMHSLYAVTKYKVVSGEFAKVYTKLFLKSRQTNTSNNPWWENQFALRLPFILASPEFLKILQKNIIIIDLYCRNLCCWQGPSQNQESDIRSSHEVSVDMFERSILLHMYFLCYYTHVTIPCTSTFAFGTIVFWCKNNTHTNKAV